MTLPVYPDGALLRGLAYAQKWSPTFFTQTATTATGAEIDIGLAQYPLHEFELTYEFLRDGGRGLPFVRETLEFRTMMGFHLAIAGTLGRFLYRNPDDHKVFQHVIGVGDGAATTFTLTRTFGANGYAGTEPVGQVDASQPFAAYLNGSATAIDPLQYALNTATPAANTITFVAPPPLGDPVAVDMHYFYVCKLGANANTFEKFMDRLWQLSKVTLRSCRPGA
jgi:hypothetical protein